MICYNKDVARIKRVKNDSQFGINILAVVASILVAFLLNEGGAFEAIIKGAESKRLLGSFVAGLFFTSFLTTAPAILVLGKIAAESSSIIPIALVGGAGAVIGDLLIFSFVRDTIALDARKIVCNSKTKRIAGICTGRIFRFVTPVIGALIIASPFPDELGLSLLGFSRIKLSLFIPISYIMNTLGIAAIATLAQSIS